MEEIESGKDKPKIYDGMQEVSWINECIQKAPIAFDVNRAIEQLKELKTYKLNMADAMLELMNKDKLGNYVCLEDVIEIFKSAANKKNGE